MSSASTFEAARCILSFTYDEIEGDATTAWEHACCVVYVTLSLQVS